MIGDIKTLNPQLPLAQLHRYTMPDGKVYEEYIQEIIHSGGPCYFLALRTADGQPVRHTLWTDEEVSQY